MIEVKNLTKTFNVPQKQPGFIGGLASVFSPKNKEVKAVENISFKIAEGEFVGLIGQNGAGKTTTLKMLSGLLYPTSGNVKVLGFTPQERKPEFQKQFTYVAGQRNQLWWDLPATETFQLNKEIYEVPDADYRERLSYLSRTLNLNDLLETPVKKLSLGQRMKAELIASLLHEPRVLFLDEPTIGLDIIAQSSMHDFLKEYNKKFNATILMTSHYMGDVEKLCERIIVVDRGRVLYDGKLSKIADKFSKYKRIRMIIKEKAQRRDFEALGNVVEFELPAVTIEVVRADAARIMEKLLKKYTIHDITIEDPPIEEIIKILFENKE